MEQFYLDCTGLTLNSVLQIQSDLNAHAIESNISTGSLCVHTTPEHFRSVKPDLQNRILQKGEKPYSEEMKNAFKAEQWNR